MASCGAGAPPSPYATRATRKRSHYAHAQGTQYSRRREGLQVWENADREAIQGAVRYRGSSLESELGWKTAFLARRRGRRAGSVRVLARLEWLRIASDARFDRRRREPTTRASYTASRTCLSRVVAALEA